MFVTHLRRILQDMDCEQDELNSIVPAKQSRTSDDPVELGPATATIATCAEESRVWESQKLSFHQPKDIISLPSLLCLHTSQKQSTCSLYPKLLCLSPPHDNEHLHTRTYVHALSFTL